jgi:release factor glutamine methyltransferase
MTVRELLGKGTGLLKTASYSDTPELDGALLLAETLHTDRAGLITRGNNTISRDLCERYDGLLHRRLNGESVAYIIGRKEFWGLTFKVTPAVLVPRPDTETLVEAALACLDRLPPSEPYAVLDMCAGSGAVGIALKHERPSINLWLSDISPGALQVAEHNARRLLSPLDTAVHLIESDLFDRIEGAFTLITANPPYVPSKIIKTLAPEVQREPRISLDGGGDGLTLIRRLIQDAKDHLCPPGTLLIEGDPNQMDRINELLETHHYQDVRAYADLSGRPRVISACCS